MTHRQFISNMLYILALAIATAVSSPATAATPAATDTLSVINNARSVVITTGASSTVIEIKCPPDENGEEIGYSLTIDVDSCASPESGQEPVWNLNLPFLQQDKSAHKLHKLSLAGPRNLYAGAVIPLSAPDAVRTAYEFGLGMIAGASYRTGRNTPEISIGLGFGCSYTRIGHGFMLDKSDDILFIKPVHPGLSDVKSRIFSFRFEIPVMITQKLYRSLGFSAGAIINLNTYTTGSSEWNTGQIHHKVSYKGLQQRILTADLIAIVGLPDDIGAYVRYSPSGIFHTGYGPGFSRLSAGVSIGF